MEKSESIKNIAIALVKFHSEVGKVAKSSTNPFFKSSYASLPNILDVIEEPLSVAELSFIQFPSGENGLTTILMHTSGEYLQESYTMKPAKNDPQGLGSAITYQRRYALGAILGLNIDEDGFEYEEIFHGEVEAFPPFKVGQSVDIDAISEGGYTVRESRFCEVTEISWAVSDFYDDKDVVVDEKNETAEPKDLAEFPGIKTPPISTGMYMFVHLSKDLP